MRLKLIITFIICIQAFFVNAQETYQITYERISNGKKIEESNPIQVLANTKETIIGTQNSFNQSGKFPNELFYFNKDKSPVISSITQFDSIHSIISNDSISFNKAVFTP
ncbi:MAG: peptide-N-glycosidase, partial [Algoriella sp.]